jgi:hypothetical protein
MKPEKAELKGRKTHQNLKAYGLAFAWVFEALSCGGYTKI